MPGKPGAGPPGIDRDLEMVASAIEALHDLDNEESRDDARAYDFSIRWGVLMSGRLRRLEHYYRARELTEDQERRFRELRRRLKDATPAIERFGIARPAVPLEDQGSRDAPGPSPDGEA